MNWVLRSTRVVAGDGIGPLSIHIEDETIVRVFPHERVPAGARLVVGGMFFGVSYFLRQRRI